MKTKPDKSPGTGKAFERKDAAPVWTAASSAALAAVTALAALILISQGSRQFVGYDSFWHVFIARQETWGSFWREVADNAHPPFFYLLLDAAIKLLGNTFLAYRAISIGATLVSTILVARIAAKITSNAWLAVAAGAAFGLSANAIEIGLEVRAYALCGALMLTAFSAYLDWLGTHPARLSARTPALFGAAMTAAVLTNYSAFFFLAAAITTPFVLYICHRRWRVRLFAEVHQRPLAIFLMFCVPLAAALSSFIVQARHWAGRMAHVSNFMYDPGRESPLAFVARTTRELVLLMSPRIGADGSTSLVAALVLLAIALWLASRRAFRKRLGLIPLVFLAVMTAANIPAALTGRYPYGGPLRHAYYLLPLAIVALFAVIAAIGRAIPSRCSWPRFWAGASALAVAANCWFWMSAGTITAVNPAQRQLDRFRAVLGTPQAVLADQYNFVILFGHYHDWKWRLAWQDTGAQAGGKMWQVWDVSRGEEHLRVCRSSRWQFDLSQPESFADLADCLARTRAAHVALFRKQQDGFLPAWKTESAAQYARDLGPRQGVDPERVIADGNDVYLLCRSRTGASGAHAP